MRFTVMSVAVKIISRTSGQRHMIQTESRGFGGISRGASCISNHDDRFAENGATAQIGKGLRRFRQIVLFVNHGL